VKKAVLVLAEGFEEVEAVGVANVLRRAGVKVMLAGLTSKEVVGAHQIRVVCDCLLDECSEDEDVLILPGGLPGAENLSKSAKLLERIRMLFGRGKIIAAICAAPALVLESSGILAGRRVTCYPGFESNFSAAQFSEERVVVDGNIVTSRGPGSALEFGLKIVELLVGKDQAEQLKQGMLI